jgi:hypothetical protein
MPKKPVKQQQDAHQRQDVDIIEIEEYPEESEEEEEVPVKKTTKKKPKAKKQVEVESESESESEEEESPQKKKSSKKKVVLPPIILQAPEKVKKPLTEKRAAALARGREKQKAIREQRKNDALEKMKKELWEDFQKQGSSAAPSAKPKDVKDAKAPQEKEPVTDPLSRESGALEHIKKMKESLPKQDERKHDAGGLFGPVQIRSFRK